MSAPQVSPALEAAQKADEQMLRCLSEGRSFLLEAGAGAGKTYSLVEALKALISSEGGRLRRRGNRIACITYTNIATAVIKSRIDSSPLVFVDTIHAFCWNLIKQFQKDLRLAVTRLPAWTERLAEAGDVSNRTVVYDLGYRRVSETEISLHHDDVLAIASEMLAMPKLRQVLRSRFPFIMIDEYQDTNAQIMQALAENVLGQAGMPLVGLFGDHWQRIYDRTCGHIAHENLFEIGKGANFRSAVKIVSALNQLRPELPQAVKDESFIGSASVVHTNGWGGTRRSGAGGGHWKGDLPTEIAHRCLTDVVGALEKEGWDFAPDKTKILMLTHNILASEQGYSNLAKVFPYNDQFVKKEHPHIAFFIDHLEPAIRAFADNRYAKMLDALSAAAPRLRFHSDKKGWFEFLSALVQLREHKSIGEVIDLIASKPFIQLPEAVLRSERAALEWGAERDAEMPDQIKIVKNLREVAYSEVISLDRFIEGHSPFATKHSVKGDEFENVLVVFGRGWNLYNFDQFLTLSGDSQNIPPDKQAFYERNRNLFYVCCSRPTTRLALLFTQELSEGALGRLERLFGKEAIRGAQIE